MGFYGTAAALFVAWSIFLGVGSYYKGRDSRTPEIAEYQAAIKASEKLAQEADERAKQVSEKVVTVYKDRVKVIREKVPGETQYIEVIKRDSTCAAPPAFRLLHDSAASGSQATQDSTGTDAAPVPLEVIAETVAENYRIARETAARLEALQEIIKSQ